jgi:hypothetical protein
VEWEREVYIALQMKYRIRFPELLAVLEGALAIGRQANVLAPDEVRTRLDAVQRSAGTPTSIPDHPKFAKIKAWLSP